MKLFAVFVGGNHPRANVELHDVRFCVGETLEDTIPQLRAAWWGTPKSLHIDGYADLTHVDGRPVRVVPGPRLPVRACRSGSSMSAATRPNSSANSIIICS